MSATATNQSVYGEVESIKDSIRSHTLEPFEVKDLVVDQGRVSVGDRFTVGGDNMNTLLSKLGIKKNLQEKSFSNPEQKWNKLRDVLSKIDHARNLAAIVHPDGYSVDIVNSHVQEPEELDYDERIDGVLNAFEASGHELYSVYHEGANVRLQTRDGKKEHNCGAGDLWETGVEAGINFNSQEMSGFFLRLICANGMTDTENIARRQVSSKNMMRQALRFIENNDFSKHLKQRVDKMRNHYASVYEAKTIAGQLDKEQRKSYAPWYDAMVEFYNDSGMPIDRMRTAQQRMAYTDQNLYDVFNLGTALATHNRHDLGAGTCAELNKACGDIFKRGPNLQVQTINPYARN